MPASNAADLALLVPAFRRVKPLKACLDAIELASPRKVYVSIDGPRPAVESDQEAVLAVKELVGTYTRRFPLEIRTNAENGGVGAGVVSALDWFFSQEESGVVIEDDLRVEPSSLSLAAELLRRYDGNPSIGSISLFNSVPMRKVSSPDLSVRFSRFASSWYWGTWRTSWAQHLKSIEDWRDRAKFGRLEQVGGREFATFWSDLIDFELSINRVPWETLWLCTHWQNDWVSANTNSNFCLNLGYTTEATNSFERPSWYPTSSIPWDGTLSLPPKVVNDNRADKWVARQMYGLGRTKTFKRILGHRAPWLRRAWRGASMKPMGSPEAVV